MDKSINQFRIIFFHYIGVVLHNTACSLPLGIFNIVLILYYITDFAIYPYSNFSLFIFVPHTLH